MSKKLSYTFSLALVLASCTLTYLITEYIHFKVSNPYNPSLNYLTNFQQLSDFKIERVEGYRFIKPIVSVEPNIESPEFKGLRARLTNYIDGLKKTNKLISASVYLRYFGHGKMMNLNPEETYCPGSMIKVANLLTYLRMGELYPGLLDKHLLFRTPAIPIPAQSFNSKQIQAGKVYTVKELLKYMIAYSDNNATYLLNKNADSKTYHKLFNELKVPLPTSQNNNFMMTAKDFSMLMKVLFNSSYLTVENSEYALDLLHQCDFKIGMVKEIPANRLVAHKFGEMADGNGHQLHESGFIYMDKAPYLLTIMTKGNNVNELAPVLSTLSKMVYDEILLLEE